MANLDELFAQPKQYDHPKLRSWLSYKNNADTTRCSVEFRREREGLSFKPARLYLEAVRKDGTIFSDREPWDEEFNTALVDHGFKARDAANESERFGYMLTARMQPLVNRFNDGFFNAILVRYLAQGGYAELPPIAAKLAKIHVNKAYEGDAAHDCEERINAVLARCAEQLARLGYDLEEGKSILIGAIAYYLDDRFSITSSELMGW
jgi:hypothetical protein